MPRAQQAAFRLRKWYLDCIDEDEQVFIGYSGNVQWGRLSVSYAASILSSPGSESAVERRSFRKTAPPTVTESGVGWTCPTVGISKVRFESAPARLDRTLAKTPKGHVAWTLIHPVAKVTTNLESIQMEGLGYSDYVELTIPPWSLPFDRLLWGRFHAKHHDVTWLRLDGEQTQSLVFHSGIEKRHAVIDENRIKLEPPDSVLELEPLRTIRSGSVAGAAFPASVHFLLPTALRKMHEHKWLSAGSLTLSDGSTHEGLAIHEEVTWK
jgi:hypothetical protein